MNLSHLLERHELLGMGFASVGQNVQIDRSVRFFGAEHIHISDHVRIDPYCIFSAGSAGIVIGRYIHIAPYCSLIGRGRIELVDFSNLSGRVSIYSSSDDFSGGAMTNPTIPPEFTNVRSSPVILERHTIVGAGSVILPGVSIGLAAAIGSLTLIRKDVPEFAIMSGNPARQIGRRSESILEREAEFLLWDSKKSGSDPN
jgi:galactoside O-acetyltransferase